MWCRLHIINVEIKPRAFLTVFPDFILVCFGTLYYKGKFNRLLCQSRAEGWKGFLTPAKPLRTPNSKGLWAREQEHVHSPVIILFLASCMAVGAWSGYHSIKIITATLRGFTSALVCVLVGDNNGQRLSNWFSPHKAIMLRLWSPQTIKNQLISSMSLRLPMDCVCLDW